MLVLAANSARGLRNVARLAAPTIPPMTRAPFTNLAPDWLIAGANLPEDGLAGLWGAGFWGNRWEYRPDASYLECRGGG